MLWTGWVDHNKTYDYIRLCNLGLIPHFVNEHKNTTVPNKLFDYMKFGLPVVASKNRPDVRLTVDTREDYEKACHIVNMSDAECVSTQKAIQSAEEFELRAKTEMS